MAEGIRLTAIDLEPGRLARVQQTLDRLGHRDAVTVIAADATQPARWWDGTAFDAILLDAPCSATGIIRSEEHTSELQSLMRISYAVFCLKKKKKKCTHYIIQQQIK